MVIHAESDRHPPPRPSPSDRRERRSPSRPAPSPGLRSQDCSSSARSRRDPGSAGASGSRPARKPRPLRPRRAHRPPPRRPSESSPFADAERGEDPVQELLRRGLPRDFSEQDQRSPHRTRRDLGRHLRPDAVQGGCRRRAASAAGEARRIRPLPGRKPAGSRSPAAERRYPRRSARSRAVPPPGSPPADRPLSRGPARAPPPAGCPVVAPRPLLPGPRGEGRRRWRPRPAASTPRPSSLSVVSRSPAVSTRRTRSPPTSNTSATASRVVPASSDTRALSLPRSAFEQRRLPGIRGADDYDGRKCIRGPARSGLGSKLQKGRSSGGDPRNRRPLS